MTIEFTEQGLQIETLQEITDRLITGFKSIYGPDINVAPDSPDGQRIGIYAKEIADMQAYQLLNYNQQDPDFATGQVLRSKIKYAGITARPATKSQADVSVTSNRITVLPQGFTIQDEIGQNWLVADDEPVAVGTTIVTFFAENFGAIEASANTINKIITIVPGVLSVNNTAAATPGVNEETNEQLRSRRRKSVQLPAVTPLGSIIARIANTAGVTDVVGYENDTDDYDPEYDLDAHHFWMIVEGGAVSDIVESMAYSKTGGAGTKGSTTGAFNEIIVRPNGSEFLIPHIMNFDRPTPIPIFIRLEAKRKNPDQPVPIGTIADKLIEYDYLTGDLVIASELYDAVYDAGDTFIAYDLEISLNGTSWTDISIDPGYDGKPFIDPSNITISEVL